MSKFNVKELMEKSHVISKDGWKIKYNIEVNTPYQKVGKYYNAVLKELRDFGGNKITRVNQSLSASPTSAFYGTVAQRVAYAKDGYNKSMGLIDNLIKNITKLIYSLRSFDQSLAIFKKLSSNKDKDKVEAELNLKRIYLDEVDIKRGRGSINQLAMGELEFVTIRDSFLVANSKSVDKLNVNDVVKRMIKQRLNDYDNWKTEYKKDLEGRRSIQKEYLRGQVQSLKDAANNAKEYHTIIQQLKMDTGVGNPDLLAGIDNSIIKTKIRVIFDRYKYVVGFCDVDFYFKTGPIQVNTAQGQSTHHIFTTRITYTPYVMTKTNFEKMNNVETFKDLKFLNSIVENSLKAIKDDLDRYMETGDMSKKEEKTEKSSSFLSFLFPLKPLINAFSLKNNKTNKEAFSTYKLNKELREATNKVSGYSDTVYGNFKDENGFPTYSPTLS